MHEFFGATELELLHRMVFEIAYAVDLGLDVTHDLRLPGVQLGKDLALTDGNWIEFTSWVGLTTEEMEEVYKLMVSNGWKPNDKVF